MWYAAFLAAWPRLRPPHFDPAGIRLNFVEPGSSFHLDTVAADAMDHGGTGLALLERAIEDLVRDYSQQQDARLQPIDSDALRAALLYAQSDSDEALRQH